MLYDNYSSALFGVIHRIVRREDVAEEILQATFLKIRDNFAQYDAVKGRLFTWVLNLGRSLAIEKTRSKDFINLSKFQTVDNGSFIPDPKLAYDPDLIGIREIVRKLEPEYRQIIDLLFFEGYSQSEVAEKLSIPLGTVKTRSRAAITRLRNFFDAKQV